MIKTIRLIHALAVLSLTASPLSAAPADLKPEGYYRHCAICPPGTLPNHGKAPFRGGASLAGHCGCTEANTVFEYSTTWYYQGVLYCGYCRCNSGYYGGKGENIGCSKCPPESIGSDGVNCDCDTAGTGMVWDKAKNACVCGIPRGSTNTCTCRGKSMGYEWNYNSNKCKCGPGLYERITGSGLCEQCPQFTFTDPGNPLCRCIDPTAGFDKELKRCVCMRGFALDKEGTCVDAKCPPGQQYNGRTEKCECTEGPTLPNGDCKTCPGTSSFNQETNICECQGTFNEDDWTCTPCSPTEEFDYEKNACVEILCPDKRQKYDPTTKKCECIESVPDRLFSASKYRDCPENATYNPTTKSCDCPGDFNLAGWRCEKCFQGFYFDDVTNSCECSNDVLQSDGKTCRNCPIGVRYDSEKKDCFCGPKTFDRIRWQCSKD